MAVSDMVMGLVTGFGLALLSGLVSISVAVWADYAKRRNVVAMGLMVFNLATSLTGFAANIYHILVGRLFLAAAEATQLAPSVSILADRFPPKSRARVMAVLGAGPSIGIILGLSAAGFLNAEFGWCITLMILGLPGMLLALLVRFTLQEPVRADEASANLAAPDAAGKSQPLRKHGFMSALRCLLGQPAFVCMLLATALNA